MSKSDFDPPRNIQSHADRSRFTRRGFLGLTGLGLLGTTGLFPIERAIAAEIAGQRIRFVNYTNWIGKGEYDGFKEASGVTVREISVNSQRVAKIMSDPTSADMVLLDLHQAGQLDAAGLLEKFNLANIPNYAGVDPNVKDGLASDAVAKVLATDLGRTGILYRTDMVSEEITGWPDVWDLAPKYSGKISLLDAPVGLVPISLISLGLSGNSRNKEELDKAAERLIQIKPHLLALQTGDQARSLIDGSAAIGMVEDWAGSAAVAGNPGLPLKWVDPAQTTGYLDVWGMVKGTKVAAAIEAFANYHFSPKIYANYCNSLSIASIVPAADSMISDAIKSNPITYPPAGVYERVQFQGYLGEGQRWHDEAWSLFKSA
jgi:spermidine/putrescine transport system substrate-binding protein